jgi:hypothetical protein
MCTWQPWQQPLQKKLLPRQTLFDIERADVNMADYDSDSSYDGEDYTETNVLLGYAAKEGTGDAISHLGGAPVRILSSRKYEVFG